MKTTNFLLVVLDRLHLDSYMLSVQRFRILRSGAAMFVLLLFPLGKLVAEIPGNKNNVMCLVSFVKLYLTVVKPF